MNKVILIGRLTRDIELKTYGETNVLSNTLAVDRKKMKDKPKESDFISIKAFGNNAEFISKYFEKGNKIAIVGRIQTGSYEKEGKKVYTTDVVVEEVFFCNSKGNCGVSTNTQESDGFFPLDDSDDLPF